MKKVSFFLLALQCVVAYGQQDKIVFTKKLEYELKEPIDKKYPEVFSMEKISVEMLVNNKEALLTLPGAMGGSSLYFVDDKDLSLVKMGFNNHLKPDFNHYAMVNDLYLEEAEKSEQKFSIIPLGIKENIQGYSCDQYLMKPIFGTSIVPKEGDDHIKVCINTTSGINNSSMISTFVKSQFGIETVEPMKGFIVKVGQANLYDTNHFIIKKVEETKDFVIFNHQKAIAQNLAIKDSLRTKFEQHKKESLSGSINTIDSLETHFSLSDLYPENIHEDQKYVSRYKTPADDVAVLAIQNLKSESKVWDVLPEYCRNIDKNLPAFDDKNLKNRVVNYTGQICDLYMAQLDYHSVAIKETIDEFRREGFDFLYDLENLSKKDRKRLIQYLKKLD